MPTPQLRLSLLSLSLLAGFAHAETAESTAELGTVYVTAERQLQQSLGVSKISAQDLEKQPVVNDISDLVRTMPGVNLTGNTATGQRGNKRQIDLRGMGPENTLILIDGRPATSRNSERISMRGERNTRGDSNWVPAEAIESIEVIRGPAAARYGSGAMGGVVNIVTKKITNEFSGSLNYYTNQPQDDDEGATNRVGFNLSGPIVKDVLSFRIYGSANKTDADDANINAAAGNADAAGVEGVRNKDIAGRLHWKINPAQSLTFDAGFSRQGNIYNGDTQNSSTHPAAEALRTSLIGSETARLYRSNFALTHTGAWDWGDTKSYISYDRTTNSRLPEYLAGGPEGSYSSDEFTNSYLKNLRLSSEAHIPFEWGVPHVLTVGAEFTDSRLKDASSNSQGFTDQGSTDAFDGIAASTRQQRLATRMGRVCRRQHRPHRAHPPHPHAALRPPQQIRRQRERRPQFLATTGRILAGKRRHRPRLQSAQPLSNRPQFYSLHPRQRLPHRHFRPLLLHGQRRFGARNQLEQRNRRRIQ
jgi:ferric enterobactin receptor